MKITHPVTRAAFGVAALVAIAVFANWLVSLSSLGSRGADFTEKQIHTLSEGTRAILGELASNLGPAGDGVFRSFLSRLPAIEDIDYGETTVVSRSIPLLLEGRVDGAVVLLRDVSELRSRDRALISKDATIR